MRQLDAHGISRRWYSFDPGTLRVADVHYGLGHQDRFGYQQNRLPWQTAFDITVSPKIASFLEGTAAGTLRQMSWIDPAFTNWTRQRRATFTTLIRATGGAQIRGRVGFRAAGGRAHRLSSAIAQYQLSAARTEAAKLHRQH